LGPVSRRPPSLESDLSIVNELDVVEQDPTVADKHGAYLRALFASWAPVASPRVSHDAQRVLDVVAGR